MLDEDCKLGNFSTTHLCWAPAPGCKPGAARPQQAVRSMQHSMLRQVWCSKHLGDLLPGMQQQNPRLLKELLGKQMIALGGEGTQLQAGAGKLHGSRMTGAAWQKQMLTL